MKVLSLFDGMSCGQIALERAGIKVDEYYASEIDKYAIKVTNHNYPNTKQLGCILDRDEWPSLKIDLLIGGSPCQGFSFAGKQLNFDDPRSKLFFEFVEVLQEYNPEYFLLENVKMKKESQDIISEYLGVEPVEINSALVSAQNRKRLYWTNIPNITQPENKNIFLKNVLEDGVDGEGCAIRGRYNKDKKVVQQLELNKTKKSNSLTTVQKDSLVYIPHNKKEEKTTREDSCIELGHAKLNGHDFLKRVYSREGKCPTLTAVCGGNQERKVAIDEKHWRKLTPLECERLQTIPDNYASEVSNSQRYKMIGNGWTVDVIAHIFKGLL